MLQWQIKLHGTVSGKYLHGTVNDVTSTVNDVTGTVNDVTGTVNWHSKSSHKLTGTVNDIFGTVNDEIQG